MVSRGQLRLLLWVVPRLRQPHLRQSGTLPPVPAWDAIEQAQPEFAGRVRSLLMWHKTIATLRGDGSPRISGIECEFSEGELRFGSMTGARKGADSQAGCPLRHPRPDLPPRGGQGR